MIKRLVIHLQLSLFTFAFIAVLFLAGCQQKQEKPAEEQQEATVPDTTTRTTYPPDTTVEGIPKKFPLDLTGTWTGTFDQRNTTLQITSQDSLSFKGKITIRYREVINQEVKGSFDPVTKKLKMADQIHSRYMGKYAGLLSDDGTKLSGTFTMNLDGKNCSFDLTKK